MFQHRNVQKIKTPSRCGARVKSFVVHIYIRFSMPNIHTYIPLNFSIKFQCQTTELLIYS